MIQQRTGAVTNQGGTGAVTNQSGTGAVTNQSGTGAVTNQGGNLIYLDFRCRCLGRHWLPLTRH